MCHSLKILSVDEVGRINAKRSGILKPVLWIGLVELKPFNQKEYATAGAFTNIVTWATDVDGFRSKVQVIAKELDMYVAEIENPEPLRERFKDAAMGEEIEAMVLRAETNPDAIVYGTFHNYPHHES